METEVLSTEDLQTILERSLGTEDVEYVSHSMRSLSEEVEGYLSEHYSLSIRYISQRTVHTKQYFLKVLANNAGFLSELSKSMQVFPAESFAYKVIFSCFNELKNPSKFAPDCYLAKDNALVLEDLAVDGFQPEERLKFYNVEQCKMFLRTIAKFHGQSFAYEAYKTKQIGKKFRWNEEYSEKLKEKIYDDDMEASTMKFYNSSLQSIRDFVDELPDDKLDKEEFKKLFDAEFSVHPSKDPLLSKYAICLIHGDIWSNNILMKYSGDQLVDCRLVDFQIYHYGSPGYDVIQFFYANTPLEFRQEHLPDLMQYYYESLKEEMLLYGEDVEEFMKYQELLDSIIVLAPSAKQMTLNDRSLQYLPQGTLAEETVSNPNFFQDLLVENRSKYTIPTFRENQDCQKYITDELIDFRDILVKKRKFLNNM